MVFHDFGFHHLNLCTNRRVLIQLEYLQPIDVRHRDLVAQDMQWVENMYLIRDRMSWRFWDSDTHLFCGHNIHKHEILGLHLVEVLNRRSLWKNLYHGPDVLLVLLDPLIRRSCKKKYPDSSWVKSILLKQNTSKSQNFFSFHWQQTFKMRTKGGKVGITQKRDYVRDRVLSISNQVSITFTTRVSWA